MHRLATRAAAPSHVFPCQRMPPFRHGHYARRTAHCRVLLSSLSCITRPISTDAASFEAGPSQQAQVLHKKILGARMFTLNRPEKLNALTLSMIRNMTPQLKAWDVSKLAKVILLKGLDGGRFCAGDDILEVLLKTRTKDPDCLRFFQEKFWLIQMISTLQTPFISVLDGYALGGAIGLFGHCPFRIATEKTIFAMPETSLGLFPSSGASFFLPKLDGQIGTYLALTGSRIEGAHTFYAGIASHYVPSVRLPALEDRLIDLEISDYEIIHRVIEEFVEPPTTDSSAFSHEIRDIIDRCFCYDTIDEIIAALDHQKPSTFVRETKQKLLSASPTSLRVTLKALRKAETMTLCECLAMEFDLIQKFMVTKDFHEGIDAMFISKHRRKPHWQPQFLDQLSEDDITQLYFSYASPNDLSFPSTLDMHQYPYARYSLPSENSVREAVTGDGNGFGPENRLKSRKEVLEWFVKGTQGKRGVREKVLDVLSRRTIDSPNGLVWT
ncbi:hypothetical protein VTP01DRAFT_487 [Rhizomucor pusillus]|uniref:mitochondrial 37S ribosomal protein mS47 n=1 Tax=Rhizomucor pusillus TaxID=4840 RepID=UPI0037426DC3